MPISATDDSEPFVVYVTDDEATRMTKQGKGSPITATRDKSRGAMSDVSALTDADRIVLQNDRHCLNDRVINASLTILSDSTRPSTV